MDTNLNSSSDFEVFANAFQSTGVPITSSPVVFGANYNGATTTTYVSAVTPSATVNPGVSGIDALSIGAAYGGGAEKLNGKMAEIVIYRRLLTPPEIQELFQYFNSRYAIAIGP